MIHAYLKKIKPVHVFFFLFHVVLLTGSPFLCDAQAKAYRIGSNDVISIIIYAGGEKQFEEDLTISARGNLNAPFIGSIKVDGLIATELEKKITESLAKDYFVNPKVIISVKEYHSLHYYISGAVKKPGLYETTTEVTLLELIAKAQGVLPDRGNVAYIMRNAADEVAAGREVKKPGVYDYQSGMTALSACITAGGFGTFAAPNRTRIIRKINNKTEIIKIDLNDVREGKIPDLQLKPGDRIHIPETWL